MALTKADENKITEIVANAINDVVIPALDDMEGRLASKEDLEKFKKETMMEFDSLNRKFDAQQDRLDKHNGRIEKVEKKLGIQTL